MCGKATLAIVLSTPCMIVASMIEAVIIPRFAMGPRASLLTRLCSFPKELSWADDKQWRSVKSNTNRRRLIGGNSITRTGAPGFSAAVRLIRLTKGQLSRYDRSDGWIYVLLDIDGTERWISTGRRDGPL